MFANPIPVQGMAVALWEEMGMCTTEGIGVWVQATRERFAEITSGRAIFRQGLVATCKDSPTKGEP